MPTFREIVPQVADAIRGHVFVAHNAGFDWRFVTTEIARATGERMEGRRLCTVKMARRLLPQLHRRSLDYLARHYNVEITARHRAGGDAVATARVFLRMLREAAGPRLRDVARPRGAAARGAAWPTAAAPERDATVHRPRYDGLTTPDPATHDDHPRPTRRYAHRRKAPRSHDSGRRPEARWRRDVRRRAQAALGASHPGR